MPNDRYPDQRPETPRVPPEIIPPDRGNRSSGRLSGVWIRVDDRDGVRRVVIGRPGLPTIIIGLLIIGLVVAVLFLLLAGVVLIWLPIVVGGILLALLAGTIRYQWYRLRTWLARGR